MKTTRINYAFVGLLGLIASCSSMVEESPYEAPLPTQETIQEGGENFRVMNATQFGAFLTGREEVPAINSSGAGSAKFEILDGGQAIKFEVRVANTSGIIFAHIHKGGIGMNGPVMVDLIPTQSPSGLVNGVVAEGMITAGDLKGAFASENLDGLIADLKSGMAYVNLHTSAFPGGELRGQVSVIDPRTNKNFNTQLSGDQEVPSVMTQARGVANFQFSKNLSFQVNVANLENVRFAHIHLGKPSENGPVVVNLKGDRIDGAVNGVYAKGEIMPGNLVGPLLGGDLTILMEAFRTGNAYVNVHTDKFPGGELRGNIR